MCAGLDASRKVPVRPDADERRDDACRENALSPSPDQQAGPGVREQEMTAKVTSPPNLWREQEMTSSTLAGCTEQRHRAGRGATILEAERVNEDPHVARDRHQLTRVVPVTALLANDAST